MKATELRIGNWVQTKQTEKQFQELAIWMTFCGYDFTQHDYYLDNRHLFTDDLSTNQNK